MSGSDVETFRAAALGQSMSGKSTLFWLLCMTAAANGERVWLFDPNGNHRGSTSGAGIVQVRPRAGVERPADNKGGRYFDDVQALATRAGQTGRVIVAVEEANLCVRRGQVAPPAITDLLHEGRHMPEPNHPRVGVGTLLCARRPQELPPAWLSQVQHLYVFRLINRRDLEAVAAEGFDPKKVRTLKRGQFFHLDAESGEPPHFHAHALTACG